MMAHTQLGNDNLLIMPGMTAGELEVEADHLLLVLSKQLLHSLDGDPHRDPLILVHHGEVLPTHVGVHYVRHGELLPVVVVSRWERPWSH